MPSALMSLLAGVAFVAASMAGFVSGASAASAAPTTTHTVGAEKIVGHQPTETRVSVGGERSDQPQHRAAPWSPLAVTADEVTLDHPSQRVRAAHSAAVQWHSYDLTTPQGRAPPR